MPKIQFDHLPREIGRHLGRRIRQRQIGLDEIRQFLVWARTEPEAPGGDWYKDFGSFKLCGRGAWPQDGIDRGHGALWAGNPLAGCLPGQVKHMKKKPSLAGRVRAKLPDTGNPRFRAECRRQSRLMAADPHEKEIMDWIEQVQDTSGWVWEE